MLYYNLNIEYRAAVSVRIEVPRFIILKRRFAWTTQAGLVPLKMGIIGKKGFLLCFLIVTTWKPVRRLVVYLDLQIIIWASKNGGWLPYLLEHR